MNVAAVITDIDACREADRKAARPRDRRLERLRRLLEEDVTLDRAYHEIMQSAGA